MATYIDWLDANEQDYGSTKEQRRALYRLGCSRAIVHTHCGSRRAAAQAISQMLALNGKLRAEETQASDYEARILQLA
jgi:hypothetical protein